MTKPSILATCLALASLAGAGCAQGQEHSIVNENLNAGRAYANIKHLVGFGPRPAGSASLENARRWIKTELREAGCRVEEDRFTADTPVGRRRQGRLSSSSFLNSEAISNPSSTSTSISAWQARCW